MLEKTKTKSNGVSIKTVGWTLGGFGVLIVAFLIVSLYMLSSQFNKVKNTTQVYMNLKLSAMEVQTASDYLTDQARAYVVTGDDEFIFNYMNEAYTSKTRESALEALEDKVGDSEAYKKLKSAVQRSVVLMNDEYYAMRLTINAFDKDYTLEKYQLNPEHQKHCEEIKQYVMVVDLKPEHVVLSKEEQKNKAIDFVYGDEYHLQKDSISKDISDSIQVIDELLDQNVIASSDQLRNVLAIQQIFIVILIIFFASAIIFIRWGLIKPINVAVDKIVKREFLESRGLKEYRYLVDAYNEARRTSINNAEKLAYTAEHDRLTGLLNRAGYEMVLAGLKPEKTIYILIDIDNFKTINDTHGHVSGDKSLIRLSHILLKYFPNDHICRLGGDEFAILIFNYEDGIKKELINRFEMIEKEALKKEKGLPSSSFSIGVAFGTKDDDTDSLYRKADRAMYVVKGKTKNGYCFYEDI